MNDEQLARIANRILSLVAHPPTEGDMRPGYGWWGMDTDCGDATSEAVAILKEELGLNISGHMDTVLAWQIAVGANA